MSQSDTEPRRRTEKVSEVLARQIVRDIARHHLPPGTVLEAESAMLERYRVSRASLREALRILEVHGLISIKPGPGGGPVVGRVDSADFGKMSTLFFQILGATVGELVEARLTIEPVMARMAAARVDDERRAALEAIIADQQSADVQSVGEYLGASMDFHATVASMSGNRILDLFASGLKDIYLDRVTGFLFPPAERETVMKAHVGIARAIMKGDEKRAERLMREHMEDYARYAGTARPGLDDEVVEWQ